MNILANIEKEEEKPKSDPDIMATPETKAKPEGFDEISSVGSHKKIGVLLEEEAKSEVEDIVSPMKRPNDSELFQEDRDIENMSPVDKIPQFSMDEGDAQPSVHIQVNPASSNPEELRAMQDMNNHILKNKDSSAKGLSSNYEDKKTEKPI